MTLWQSDGTVAGTRSLMNLPATAGPAGFGSLWAAGADLFYSTPLATTSQLWRTDGTPQGTIALAAIGAAPSDPMITAAGGRIYVVGTHGSGDGELWQTDGTVAGTAPVEVDGHELGGIAALLGALTAAGSRLFFFIDDPSQNPASITLWQTDATTAGSSAIATFRPADSVFTMPRSLAVLGSQLLFAMDDGVHGSELWASDGSSAGTRLVRDINPGASPSSPANFAVAAGKVYFAADDGLHGAELWQTDGTAAGTRLVQDINPGPAGSYPSGLTQAGNFLFFAADDGLTGTEPWALPLSGPTSCQPGPTNLCLLGNRFKVEALWLDPQGESGAGQAGTLTPDSGTFWFFSPDNLEIVAKVIDGRSLDDSFWFFYGATAFSPGTRGAIERCRCGGPRSSPRREYQGQAVSRPYMAEAPAPDLDGCVSRACLGSVIPWTRVHAGRAAG